jgi:hypothetical protein
LLSFSPAVNYPVGNSPQAVVTGDFNGDGRLDLAIANSFSNTVSVLLDNANGTFKPALTAATGTGPKSVAVGDFNKDGKLDLATANTYDLSVLLGKGDGTFGPASKIDIGSNPTSVAVGDFNADGKLDLGVTSNVITFIGGYYANYYISADPRANVLLGNGTGAFPTVNATSLGYSAGYHTSAAVADFNADGKQDFATVNRDSGTVRVLLGSGNGKLLAPTEFGIGNYPLSVAVGDVNGDSHIDLVTANFADNSVSVLLGDGAGGFGAAHNDAVGSLPINVKLADFNRDTHLDIITANSDYDNTGVSVLLGRGDGTFSTPLNSPAGNNTWAVAAGDFNGDGWLDAATVNAFTNNASILLNTGDWSTTAHAVSFTVSGFPSAATAGKGASFTVTAKNTDGTTDTAYKGVAHFTSSDAQASLPPDYTFTAADGGVHAFSAALKTAGTQSITATETLMARLTGSQAGITVNPAAASTMTVAGFPSPITVGVGGRLTVTLDDPYGNRATGYTGTVHFTSSDRNGSLPANYQFTATDAGAHTFSATLKTVGKQSLTATDTRSASLTGTDAGIVVKSRGASRFVLRAPASVTAGVRFSLTLTVKDASGNVVTGYLGTIRLKSTDGTASLPGNYTFRMADRGVHTFTGVVLRKRGTRMITLTDTLNSSLTGSMIENVI